MSTAMKHAFEKAGRTEEGAALSIALARYVNSSRGSLEEFEALIAPARAALAERGQECAAQDGQSIIADLRHPTGGKDQSCRASDGQMAIVPPSQPNPGEGHYRGAKSGQVISADARTPLPGKDQCASVQQDHFEDVPAGQPVASRTGQMASGQQAFSSSARSAREPSDADIEALKESGDFHYFQMINLRKKAWSTYRYNQLKNVRSLNMQENMVINDVIDWGRKHKVKEDDLVSLTMPASEMKKIINHAKNAIPSKAEAISKPATRSARHGR